MFIQDTSAQYFGRNKVQYDDFNFRVMTTPDFKVYFYPEEERGVSDAVRMLERWYSRYSDLFDYRFSQRNPIIFYASSADFQQTNVIPGIIGQGTGGVTEGMKQRVVLPLSGTYEDIDHVIGHELVHVFHYDIRRRGMAGGMSAQSSTPLWFIEGMSEYFTLGRDHPHTAMWLRDAVINDSLPTLMEMSRDPSTYFPYRWGHAFWAYVAGRWGDEIVPEMYKYSTRAGWRRALTTGTGYSIEELSSQWRSAINETYTQTVAGRTNPSDFGRRVELDSTMNLAPSFSPDGTKLALLSRRDIFTIDLYLVDAASGEVIRKISSSLREPHFDALRFIDSSGSWSPDGDRFAFVVYAEGKNDIAIIDVESGDIVRQFHPEGIGSLINPAWSPDGGRIAFTGSTGGINDLYVYELETGTVTRLTDDRYSEYQPAWSPDGNTIAFVSDRGPETDFNTLTHGPMTITLLDYPSGDIRVPALHSGTSNSNPQFSPDGRSLFYISDRNGFFDIYRYSLTSGEITQVTDITTGVIGITPLAPAMSVSRADGSIACTLFDDGEYFLHEFQPDAEEARIAAKEGALARESDAGLLPPVDEHGAGTLYSLLHSPERGLPENVDEYEVTDYNPSLDLAYVGATSIGLTADRFGTSLGGGIGLLFNDMLGNHTLGVDVRASGNSFENIGAQTYYINRDSRLNWGGSASRIPYISSQVSQGTTTITVDGEQVEAVRLRQRTDRVFVSNLEFDFEFPFSTILRTNIGGGYRHIRYESEVEEAIVYQDRLVSGAVRKVPAPEPLDLFHTAVSVTGDNSYFGFTSPVRGERYVFQVEPIFGSLQYHDVLMDYRRYFFTRYLTTAVRVLHFGRYGADAENDRMSPLFVGYGTYIRGYEIGSFDIRRPNISEGGVGYPAFDRLVGSRIGVVNLEFRIPLVGNERYGIFASRYLPIELAAFTDIGAAWTKDDTPQLRFDTDTTDRVPVFSSGGAVRLNLLGYLVMEVYYAYPFQHKRDGGHWGFQIVPGW